MTTRAEAKIRSGELADLVRSLPEAQQDEVRRRMEPVVRLLRNEKGDPAGHLVFDGTVWREDDENHELFHDCLEQTIESVTSEPNTSE